MIRDVISPFQLNSSLNGVMLILLAVERESNRFAFVFMNNTRPMSDEAAAKFSSLGSDQIAINAKF